MDYFPNMNHQLVIGFTFGIGNFCQFRQPQRKAFLNIFNRLRFFLTASYHLGDAALYACLNAIVILKRLNVNAWMGIVISTVHGDSVLFARKHFRLFLIDTGYIYFCTSFFHNNIDIWSPPKKLKLSKQRNVPSNSSHHSKNEPCGKPDTLLQYGAGDRKDGIGA